MNSPSIKSRLEALRAAGIDYEEISPGRYRVGPHGFSYWPGTNRWRSFRDRVGGYGIQKLVEAVREGPKPADRAPSSRQ